jgi:uncharacterized membrane-anchored protein
MMKKLRGRNLAHPGCLIGITLGLTLGLIIAGVLAASLNMPLNTVLLTWLAFTIVLGMLGWIIGDRLSARFPVVEQENGGAEQSASSETAPSSDVS